MVYLTNRVIPNDIPPTVYHCAFQIIIDKFSEEWLNESGTNPLQILWQKKDALSFYEICAFGISLNSIKNKNDSWLEDNISKIINGNPNQIAGAIFEILAAAILNSGEYNLNIPPVETPGYDLRLKFNDNSKMDISCKDHGISIHERNFNDKALQFEKKFAEICEKYNIKRIQCRIYIKEYPEPLDWDLLNDWIEILIIMAKVRGIRPQFDGWELKNWYVGISGLVSDQFYFDRDNLSYNILIISPFHRNEIQNLYSKLDYDCHNLSEHGEEQDENNINVICVHLHPTASLDNCEKWTREYFEEFEDKPVSAILYLQPRIEKDRRENKPVLVCGYRLVTNKFYENWVKEERKLSLTFRIMNYFSDEDAIIKIVQDDFKEVRTGINTETSYVFHKANYHGKPRKKKFMLPLEADFTMI